MGAENKVLISLPIKHRNKCRDPTFLMRGPQRLSSHLKCPNTAQQLLGKISLLITFKRNNLDKTSDSIWYTLQASVTELSTELCQRGREDVGPAHFSLWSNECLWFVTLGIIWNSSGRHKHKPDTFAHSRGDLSKSWGELIKP